MIVIVTKIMIIVKIARIVVLAIIVMVAMIVVRVMVNFAQRGPGSLAPCSRGPESGTHHAASSSPRQRTVDGNVEHTRSWATRFRV